MSYLIIALGAFGVGYITGAEIMFRAIAEVNAEEQAEYEAERYAEYVRNETQDGKTPSTEEGYL